MRKKDELNLPSTCIRNAHDEEMVFVLLSRDPAAPIAIRAWVTERLRLGKNVKSDAQIVEALKIAATMAKEGRKWADKQPCGVRVRGGLVPSNCELPKNHAGPHCYNDGMYP